MLLLVNVDDLSGEAIPYVIDGLTARGAMAVHVVQTLTKKGRAGFLLFIDAPAEQIETLGAFLAAEIGTLGLRAFEPRHIHFEYQTATVDIHLTDSRHPDDTSARVRVKKVFNHENQVVFVKAEDADLQAALRHLTERGAAVSLAMLKRWIEQTVMAGESEGIQNVRLEYTDT
ncbi:MAG TPA: DUF111 family protein [Chloroflexi bacterium]|nr:DUF111 family protein [Chloroflexota bacterium]